MGSLEPGEVVVCLAILLTDGQRVETRPISPWNASLQVGLHRQT